MASKIIKDHVDEWFDYGLHLPSRTITLSQSEYSDDNDDPGVDHVMLNKFTKGMHLLELTAVKDKGDITILLNTPGGDIYQGMIIYDIIKMFPYHVTIKARGTVYSMGAIILQAGSERVLTPHTVFMMHEGTDAHSDNHTRIVKNWVKFGEKYGKIMDEILYQKILKKNPNFKRKKFEDLQMFDTPMLPQEVIDMGLADEIEEYPI